MFNNNPYYQPGMPQGPAFTRPAFQQPMMYPQQPAMMQDGMIQARFVSGREEAVASNVMPGSMFLFCDRANGMVYSKLIDPQTGMPEFKTYAEVQQAQPQPPQYATAGDLSALRIEIEQMIDQRMNALTGANSALRMGAADE